MPARWGTSLPPPLIGDACTLTAALRARQTSRRGKPCAVVARVWVDWIFSRDGNEVRIGGGYIKSCDIPDYTSYIDIGVFLGRYTLDVPVAFFGNTHGNISLLSFHNPYKQVPDVAGLRPFLSFLAGLELPRQLLTVDGSWPVHQTRWFERNNIGSHRQHSRGCIAITPSLTRQISRNLLFDYLPQLKPERVL